MSGVKDDAQFKHTVFRADRHGAAVLFRETADGPEAKAVSLSALGGLGQDVAIQREAGFAGVFHLEHHKIAPAVCLEGDHPIPDIGKLGGCLKRIVERISEKGIDFTVCEEREQGAVDHVGEFDMRGKAEDVFLAY